MTLANQSTTINQGEHVDLPFTAKDENDQPINLTLAAVTALSFEWWADGDRTKKVTKAGAPTSAEIGFKTNGVDGQFLVRLLPADFQGFESPISGRYVVKATISAKIDTLATGVISVDRTP